MLIAAKHAKLSDRTANDMFFMFLLTGIYFFYGFLNSTSLQGTLYVCLIPILFYADRKFLTDAFEKFVYVFSITLAFSIIQFILVQILGISMPAKSIQPLNKAKQASYLAYTFYVTTNQWGADILPRFFGYYDEPGVVGTLSGLILMTRQSEETHKYSDIHRRPAIFLSVFLCDRNCLYSDIRIIHKNQVYGAHSYLLRNIIRFLPQILSR